MPAIVFAKSKSEDPADQQLAAVPVTYGLVMRKKVLTQQLRQMEDESLVHQEVFAQVPPKVVYTLTERGHTLRPVLQSLYDWSVAQSAK